MNKEKEKLLSQAEDYTRRMVTKLISEYGLKENDFYTTRREPYTTIREVMWYRLDAMFKGVSTSRFGRLFKRNHSTYIQGRRRGCWLISINDKLATEILDKIFLLEKLETMDKTKTIYISLPFAEVTKGEILERATAAKNKFKAQGYCHVKTSLDLLPTLTSVNERIWMGDRIQTLLGADIVVFANGWYDDKRCQLEKDACTRFNIEHFTDGKI